jgi:uncharacterized protein YndB with AHSA1/START domain
MSSRGRERHEKESSMTRTIEQTIDFTGVDPARLFDLYIDPEQHSAATGGPVEIEPTVGGRFAALGGLRGRYLAIEPSHLIVQTWRAKVWSDDDPDSILVLTFTSTETGARVQLVQANVPARVHQTIDDGWRQHYWNKWATYLADHS